MCKCISCYGGPDSYVTCYAEVGTARVKQTEENKRMLAETGRNYENISIQQEEWR